VGIAIAGVVGEVKGYETVPHGGWDFCRSLVSGDKRVPSIEAEAQTGIAEFASETLEVLGA
jgi:hypothetical protein